MIWQLLLCSLSLSLSPSAGYSCLDYVGNYGIWMLICERARCLTEYLEPELRDEQVIYDELGKISMLWKCILCLSSMKFDFFTSFMFDHRFFLNIGFQNCCISRTLKRRLKLINLTPPWKYVVKLLSLLFCYCKKNL